MMAFPYKDNTNTGGEVLCASCFYAEGICRGEFLCAKDGEFHYCVGICNKYKEFKRGEEDG